MGLSRGEALTLAQSVRSSPKACPEEMSAVDPCSPTPMQSVRRSSEARAPECAETPAPGRLCAVAPTLSDPEERALLASVQLVVQRVYTHVRDHARESGD